MIKRSKDEKNNINCISNVNGYINSQVSTIQQRLKQASNARALEAAGGEVLYANNSTTPLTDEQIAKLPFDLYREGYIYYGKTHAHPNSSGRYTLSSLIKLVNFYQVNL